MASEEEGYKGIKGFWSFGPYNQTVKPDHKPQARKKST